ncbi:hypothetical protein HOF65_07280 [bacterium]|nr:hypothetical protein [bacterium]
MCVNFFESFISSRNFLLGKLSESKHKAQATTDQSQGHLQASSIQIFIFPIF